LAADWAADVDAALQLAALQLLTRATVDVDAETVADSFHRFEVDSPECEWAADVDVTLVVAADATQVVVADATQVARAHD